MSMLEPAKLTTFFFFPLKTQTPAKTPFSKTFTSAVGIIRDKELLKSLVFLSQPLYICIKHSKSNTPFRHPIMPLGCCLVAVGFQATSGG